LFENGEWGDGPGCASLRGMKYKGEEYEGGRYFAGDKRTDDNLRLQTEAWIYVPEIVAESTPTTKSNEKVESPSDPGAIIVGFPVDGSASDKIVLDRPESVQFRHGNLGKEETSCFESRVKIWVKEHAGDRSPREVGAATLFENGEWGDGPGCASLRGKKYKGDEYEGGRYFAGDKRTDDYLRLETEAWIYVPDDVAESTTMTISKEKVESQVIEPYADLAVDTGASYQPPMESVGPSKGAKGSESAGQKGSKGPGAAGSKGSAAAGSKGSGAAESKSSGSAGSKSSGSAGSKGSGSAKSSKKSGSKESSKGPKGSEEEAEEEDEEEEEEEGEDEEEEKEPAAPKGTKDEGSMPMWLIVAIVLYIVGVICLFLGFIGFIRVYQHYKEVMAKKPRSSTNTANATPS